MDGGARCRGNKGKRVLRTFPISEFRLQDLQHVDRASSVRGGKDDFRIHADFLADLMPVFDDCIGAVDDRAVHVKEL